MTKLPEDYSLATGAGLGLFRSVSQNPEQDLVDGEPIDCFIAKRVRDAIANAEKPRE